MRLTWKLIFHTRSTKSNQNQAYLSPVSLPSACGAMSFPFLSVPAPPFTQSPLQRLPGPLSCCLFALIPLSLTQVCFPHPTTDPSKPPVPSLLHGVTPNGHHIQSKTSLRDSLKLHAPPVSTPEPELMPIPNPSLPPPKLPDD